MSTILHVSSSARTTESISRQLTSEFVARLQKPQPGSKLIERDVAMQPLPHLSEAVLGAFFTPAAQRTSRQATDAHLSELLIAEVMAADIIVIGAPMYNFSISSSLKAWIDHIARAGLTFKYGATGPVGLVTGKRVFVFTARGGVYSEGPASVMDYHETYLRAVLGFLGMSDVTFIHSEGLAKGADAVALALSKTRGEINHLAPA